MKPLDRRVVRTRRMLGDALIALILERGYDAITVQDIADRADLRRATFYLHYKTKEELLLATLEATFDELVGQIEALTPDDPLAHKANLDAYLVTFRHAAEYSRLYRALLSGAAAASVSRRMLDYLADYFLRHVNLAPAPDVPLDVLANYIAGTEVTLLTWWLEHDQPYSPEQMAAWTQKLLLNGALSGAFAPPAPDQIQGDQN